MISKINIHLIACLFFSLTSYANAPDQKVIVIKKNKKISVDKYLGILEDKEHKLTIYDAASQKMQDKYIYPAREAPNFGFSNSVYWIKIHIVDSSGIDDEWVLIKNYPMLEDVRFYSLESTEQLGGGVRNYKLRYDEQFSGVKEPITNKTIQSSEFVATVPVKEKLKTFYLRISTRTNYHFSFDLITHTHYINNRSTELLFQGVFYGLLTFMVLYNFFLFISTKEKSSLYYILFVTSYTFYRSCYDGNFYYVSEKFFSLKGNINYPMLGVTSLILFWLLFTREFLSTRIYTPRIHRMLNVLAVYASVQLALVFFITPEAIITLFSISGLSFFILGMITAIIALHKGNKFAKFYIIALSGTVAAFFIISATIIDLLPINYFTNNVLALGILWETTVLSFTLVYRINLLKAEKEREKAIIRNQIAADLHDDIGSTLTKLALKADIIQHGLDVEDKNIGLKRISEMSRQAISTMSDIVWSIDSRNDSFEGMVNKMKDFAFGVLAGKEIKVQFNTSGFDKSGKVRVEIRQNLFLILKEAVNNIAKHSDANKVEINLSLDRAEFSLVIKDNGTNFCKKEFSVGQGLKNMKMRAEKINSKIEYKNEEGFKVCISGKLET